jgi:hypothetical protein
MWILCRTDPALVLALYFQLLKDGNPWFGLETENPLTDPHLEESLDTSESSKNIPLPLQGQSIPIMFVNGSK